MADVDLRSSDGKALRRHLWVAVCAASVLLGATVLFLAREVDLGGVKAPTVAPPDSRKIWRQPRARQLDSQPGWRLDGEIVCSAPKLLSRTVVVRAWRSGDADRMEPVTTQEVRVPGEFALDLPADTPLVDVTCECPGLPRQLQRHVRSTDRVRFAIDAIQIVRVVVVDERSAPVRGVCVRIRPVRSMSIVESVADGVTDDRGSVELTMTWAGDGLVQVAATDRLQFPAKVARSGEGDLIEVKVAGVSGESVRGIVLDRATRQPVPAAGVSLVDGSRRGVTDGQGRFEINNVACKLSPWLRIGATGYGGLVVRARCDEELVIEIDHGRVISGRVVRRDGTGVADLEVTTREYDEARDLPDLIRNACTESDGRFSIADFSCSAIIEISGSLGGETFVADVAPGEGDLDLGDLLLHEMCRLRVSLDPWRQGGDLRSAMPHAHVERIVRLGKVQDGAYRQRIARTWTRALSPQGAIFSGLPEGSYSVTATLPSNGISTSRTPAEVGREFVEVTESQREYNIVLPWREDLAAVRKVRFVWEDSGRGLNRLRFTLVSGSAAVQARTDGDGWAEVSNEYSNDTTLVIHPQRTMALEAVVGSQIQLSDFKSRDVIKVERGVVLTGRVVREGASVANAPIYALLRGGGLLSVARTKSDGGFEIIASSSTWSGILIAEQQPSAGIVEIPYTEMVESPGKQYELRPTPERDVLFEFNSGTSGCEAVSVRLSSPFGDREFVVRSGQLVTTRIPVKSHVEVTAVPIDPSGSDIVAITDLSLLDLPRSMVRIRTSSAVRGTVVVGHEMADDAEVIALIGDDVVSRAQVGDDGRAYLLLSRGASHTIELRTRYSRTTKRVEARDDPIEIRFE